MLWQHSSCNIHANNAHLNWIELREREKERETERQGLESAEWSGVSVVWDVWRYGPWAGRPGCWTQDEGDAIDPLCTSEWWSLSSAPVMSHSPAPLMQRDETPRNHWTGRSPAWWTADAHKRTQINQHKITGFRSKGTWYKTEQVPTGPTGSQRIPTGPNGSQWVPMGPSGF